jgi:hypothetical protein
LIKSPSLPSPPPSSLSSSPEPGLLTCAFPSSRAWARRLGRSKRQILQGRNGLRGIKLSVQARRLEFAALNGQTTPSIPYPGRPKREARNPSSPRTAA